MKKILIAAFTIANFLFLLNNQLKAQHATTNPGKQNFIDKHFEQGFKKTFPKESSIVEVSTKAIRNFLKQFKNAEDVHWYNVNDGIIVCFTQDGIQKRADYTRKGIWLHSLRSYPAKFLPEGIKTNVKYAFIDFNITWVNEIQTPNEIIYRIIIEDANHIKVIRICNDELKVLEEYIKS